MEDTALCVGSDKHVIIIDSDESVWETDLRTPQLTIIYLQINTLKALTSRVVSVNIGMSPAFS